MKVVDFFYQEISLGDYVCFPSRNTLDLIIAKVTRELKDGWIEVTTSNNVRLHKRPSSCILVPDKAHAKMILKGRML